MKEYLNVKIIPFELNFVEFYEHYDNALIFYRTMAEYLKEHNPNVKIIDYSEFEQDSSSILALLDIEDDGASTFGQKSIKNPGSPEAWISNWHDIQTELYRLKRIPEIR
jgi:hypothetical protein